MGSEGGSIVFTLKHFLALPSDRRRLERDIELSIVVFAHVGDLDTVAELLEIRRERVLQ